MSAHTILQARGLAAAAGDTTVIEGLDLDLARGELVAVGGHSGCGKTTLLRTLAGLADPAAGEVLLDGRRPGEIGWPRYRRKAVYVEQRPVMFDASARDNLRRAFGYASSDDDYDEDKAAALMDRLLLGRGLLGRNALDLSEGQRQRVSLIRAIIVEPLCMFLDEPTSALDPEASEAVIGLLRELAREKGLAALVVTHDREGAKQWAGRIVDISEYAAPGSGVCLTPAGEQAMAEGPEARGGANG